MMTSPSPTASVQHLAPRLYEAMRCPSVLCRPRLIWGQPSAQQKLDSEGYAPFWLAELMHTPPCSIQTVTGSRVPQITRPVSGHTAQ